MTFQKINIEDLDMNAFQAIGKDWMLITAGDSTKVNTMTASWGGMGVLWGENIVTIYVRPQRYTKQFIDKNNCFTLSFFDGKKKELGILGSISGKDEDKIHNVGFHTTFLEDAPTFTESKLVFICEKLYEDKIEPELFIDKSLDEKWYPQKDYHHVYIAKINAIYKQIKE